MTTDRTPPSDDVHPDDVPLTAAPSHRAARLREPSRTRQVALLGAVVVMQLLFVLSYLAAFHDPHPAGLPVSVSGPTAAVSQQAADQLAASGGIDPRVVSSAQQARADVRDRSSTAALVVGERGDTLLVASAAGPSEATALTTALRSAESRQGRTLSVQDLVPLPAQDSRGLTPFYVMLVLVFGGYLGVTVVGQLSPTAPRTARAALRRLAGLTAYALVSSVSVVGVARIAFGVLDGHELQAMAAGTLVAFAAATVTTALQTLLGLAGTGVVILLFVVLGNPASGGAIGYHLLPGVLGDVGPFLVNGAGVDLLRAVVYLPQAAVGGAIAVLVAWTAAGVALEVALASRAGRRVPVAPAPTGVLTTV